MDLKSLRLIFFWNCNRLFAAKSRGLFRRKTSVGVACLCCHMYCGYTLHLNSVRGIGTTLATAHRLGRNRTSNDRDSENRDCTALFMQLVTFAISPYGFGLHFLKLTVYAITSLSLSCLHGTGESPVRWRVSLSHRPIEKRLTSRLHCDQGTWAVSLCGRVRLRCTPVVSETLVWVLAYRCVT